VTLASSFATAADRDELAQFVCWDGNPYEPWVEEAQNFVRAWMLSRTQHCLMTRGEARRLIAVAAFDPRVIGLPLVRPIDHNAWHIQVLAVSLPFQAHGLAASIFDQVFAAMRQLDPDRVLVTANVHRDNHHSLSACSKVGITPLVPVEEAYWLLLGEVPAL
jgi:hypothetical protein